MYSTIESFQRAKVIFIFQLRFKAIYGMITV